MSEGFLRFRGHRTWYRVSGDLRSGRVPLLLLHGGPGMPGAAFEPLEALSDSRPVIRYDQLGCGRSDRPGDPSLWQIPTFIDELDAIRGELGLERLHLLGWSWGGMLALITSGRFDEATPAHMERLRAGIPLSRWVCFEQSSHSAFIEEPERYRAVLEGFLDGVEG